MRVALGVDHRGFSVKEDLIALLKESGNEVLDLGTHSTDSVDYPGHRESRRRSRPKR